MVVLKRVGSVSSVSIGDISLMLDSVGDYTPYKTITQHDQPNFGAYHLTDIPGEKFPHTKAIIYNNLEGNDQVIARGELLIILRMMLGQLKKRRFIQHMIAPVILLLLLFFAFR